MKNKKKGQVALEFLMTYGWAFLIILVVIGAFVYFDVLNPQRSIGGRCTFSPGLNCNAYQITSDAVVFEVRNELGRTIDEIVSVEIKETSPVPTDSYDINCATIDPSETIASNMMFTVTCDGTDVDLEVGDRFQGDIRVKYKVRGSELEQTITGGISGSVTE